MWNIKKIVSKGDYEYAVVYNHPNSTKNNYVLHHRIVMENHLGRLLGANEVVHHVNGNKKDNRLENLTIMRSSEHAEFHQKDSVSSMVVMRCPFCGKVFEKRRGQTHLLKGGNYTSCSRSCGGKIKRYQQLKRVTHEMDVAISENVLYEYKGKLRANPLQGDA